MNVTWMISLTCLRIGRATNRAVSISSRDLTLSPGCGETVISNLAATFGAFAQLSCVMIKKPTYSPCQWLICLLLRILYSYYWVRFSTPPCWGHEMPSSICNRSVRPSRRDLASRNGAFLPQILGGGSHQ